MRSRKPTRTHSSSLPHTSGQRAPCCRREGARRRCAGPSGAAQGLAPERVVYAGTASKTLAPGLRLGWLVVPGHLVDDVSEAKSLADPGSPVLDQLAFADFLGRGEFDRHLRRMRPLYRRRRDTLSQALRELLPNLEPAGIAAGLHLVGYLPSDLDERHVIDAAARRGIAVYGLSQYRVSRDGRERSE